MSRTISVLTAIALSFSAALMIAIGTGCDTSPAQNGSIYITVTPRYATVPEGQSQVFTASGALTYRWSLELSQTNGIDINDTNTIWGILDRDVGDTVMYTNLRTPPLTTEGVERIQILRVTGYIGSGGTTTNGTTVDALSASTEAYITHVR